MPVRITCPSCQISYPVDDALRGKRVLCIHCDRPMQIPAAASKATPPAPVKAAPAVQPALKNAVQPAKVKPASRAVTPADDDPDEPRGRRRAAPAKRGILPLILIGCGALVLLVLVGGAAAVIGGIFLISRSSEPEAKAAPSSDPGTKPDKKTDITTKAEKEVDPIDEPGPGGQLSKNVRNKVVNATVYMQVTQGDGRVAEGSGFLAFEPGLVLTNAHVVGMLKPEQEPPKQVSVVLNSGETNERRLTGTVLGVDRSADLAVVRVPIVNLPAPLTLKTSADLELTQAVYIFGFPFGEKLGKNVTVSATQVSSLRKGPAGELKQVQVNGGMHPGNSGGPVVNAKGEVVGVSVAGIPGTQINFAVPCEAVHALMQGRIANLGMSHTFKDAGTTKVGFQVELLDPLQKAKQVKLHWWVGNEGQAQEGLKGPAPQLAGESQRQSLPMNVQAGLATAHVRLPALTGSQCVWIQAALINGAGQTHWSAAVPCRPYEPLGAEEVALVLKPAFGARYVFLDSTNFMRLSEPGKKDTVYNIVMQNRMVETTAGIKADKTLLFLHYRKYGVSLPSELVGKNDAGQRFNSAMKEAGKLTAVLIVDNKNRIEANEADVSKVTPSVRKDLLDLHGQVQDSLEILSLPLPGKVVRPGAQWKAARPLMMFTGARDDLPPLMVTYTFQGTHVRHGRTEAVIAIDAVSSGFVGGSVTVTGRVTGKAYFDVQASQITLAEVTAKMDLEKEGKGKLSASLASKLERHLGHEVLFQRGKLTPQSYQTKTNNAYAQDYEVHLEQGKTYHIGLEGPGIGKGAVLFEPKVMVADLKDNVMSGRDEKDVGPATVFDFVPRNTGKHIVRVTTIRPGQIGDFLVVVRRLDGSPKY
jgi:S1-C subfamily serine protease